MDSKNKGFYNLVIYNKKGINIKIGKLGEFFFTRGYYIYTGSAQNSLQKRVERHLSSTKKLHWHVDYFLEYAKITKVYTIESTEKSECVLSNEVSSLPDAQIVINGFGSSDCSCKTHLHFFTKLPIFKKTDKHLKSCTILNQMKLYKKGR